MALTSLAQTGKAAAKVEKKKQKKRSSIDQPPRTAVGAGRRRAARTTFPAAAPSPSPPSERSWPPNQQQRPCVRAVHPWRRTYESAEKAPLPLPHAFVVETAAGRWGRQRWRRLVGRGSAEGSSCASDATTPRFPPPVAAPLRGGSGWCVAALVGLRPPERLRRRARMGLGRLSKTISLSPVYDALVGL